jgi:hypothetical protein
MLRKPNTTASLAGPGQKIIAALQDAVADNLVRVTIDGQTRVRKNEIPESAKTYSDTMPPDGWGYAEEADPELLIGLAEWVEGRAEKHHAYNCFEAAEALDNLANGLRLLAEEAKNWRKWAEEAKKMSQTD